VKEDYVAREDECFTKSSVWEDSTLHWLSKQGLPLYRGYVGLGEVFEQAVTVDLLRKLGWWAAAGERYFSLYPAKAASYMIMDASGATTSGHVATRYAAFGEYDPLVLASRGMFVANSTVKKLLRGEYWAVRKFPKRWSMRMAVPEERDFATRVARAIGYRGEMEWDPMLKFLKDGRNVPGGSVNVVMGALLAEEMTWMPRRPRGRVPGEVTLGLRSLRVYSYSQVTIEDFRSMDFTQPEEQKRRVMEILGSKPHVLWDAAADPRREALRPVNFGGALPAVVTAEVALVKRALDAREEEARASGDAAGPAWRPVPAQPPEGNPREHDGGRAFVGGYVLRRQGAQNYEVLAHARSQSVHHMKGLICSPGGRAARGEPPELALSRELSEEALGGAAAHFTGWRYFHTTPFRTLCYWVLVPEDFPVAGPAEHHKGEIDMGFSWDVIPGSRLISGTGHAWLDLNGLAAREHGLPYADVFLDACRVLWEKRSNLD
jgi:hypothetical protein